ncbi:MAG: MarC family protein [Proteobacteria bacterium]|nr:MarC family protein [Pseudomonadota bacterium]
MTEIMEIAIPVFVTLFVVIDPIAIAPIFAALTADTEAAHRRSMALKGCLIGAMVLFFFALLGKSFLGALGISMAAFRAAGGVMLFLIAMDMVFEKRTERREKRAEHMVEEHEARPGEEHEDISVFPIAVPMLAGPGAIATVMLLMSDHQGDATAQGVVLATLAVVLLITLILLLAASRILDAVGQSVANVLTRVLGMILAALATQYIFDGIRGGLIS